MKDLFRGMLRLLARAFKAIGYLFRPWSTAVRVLQSEIRLAQVRHRGPACTIGEGSQVIHGEFMKLGNRVSIGPFSRIESVPCYAGAQLSPTLIIEDGVSTGWFAHIACAKLVRIGRDTLIGGNVYISDHNHGYSGLESFRKRPADTRLELSPVSIGERCWIGEHVCVLPGVTIGDDCIIGAGSVVTRDIPSRMVAVGVPARPIKRRDEAGRWLPLTKT